LNAPIVIFNHTEAAENAERDAFLHVNAVHSVRETIQKREQADCDF